MEKCVAIFNPKTALSLKDVVDAHVPSFVEQSLILAPTIKSTETQNGDWLEVLKLARENGFLVFEDASQATSYLAEQFVFSATWLLFVPDGYLISSNHPWKLGSQLELGRSFELQLIDELDISRWSLNLIRLETFIESGYSLLEGVAAEVAVPAQGQIDSSAIVLRRSGESVRKSALRVTIDPSSNAFDKAKAYMVLSEQKLAKQWLLRALAVVKGQVQESWLILFLLARSCHNGQHLDSQGLRYALAAFEIWPVRLEPLLMMIQYYRLTGEADKAFSLLGLTDSMDALPIDGHPFHGLSYEVGVFLERFEFIDPGEVSQLDIKKINGLLKSTMPLAMSQRLVELRDKAYSVQNATLPIVKEGGNYFVIIVAFRNAGDYLQPCIDSIASQDYKNYHVMVIDDASTDSAADRVDFSGLSSYDLIRNTVRKGAMQNQVEAMSRSESDSDVFVFLDGDDRFSDSQVLSKVNEVYRRTDCWLTYGQSQRSNDAGYGFAHPFVESDDLADMFAKLQIEFPIHLRTHRAGLFKRLLEQDTDLLSFKDENGEYIAAASDVAHMRAMMLLAGKVNIRYIPDVLYTYNTENPDSHFRIGRTRLDADAKVIAQKPPLKQIDNYLLKPEVSKPINPLSKLLLIALEGADINVIKSMVSQGGLPNLANLLRYQHELTAVPGFGNDVFWRSIYSGQQPGKHKMYYRILHDRQQDKIVSAASSDWIGVVNSFWHKLGVEGKRVAVLNACDSKPLFTPNVTRINGWLTHAPTSMPSSNPPALIDLLNEGIDHELLAAQVEDTHLARADEVEGILELMQARIDAKLQAYLTLLKQGGWDLFYCVFDQLHEVSHRLWHFHDPLSPVYNDVYQDNSPVESVYKMVDQALGKVIESYGDGQVGVIAGLSFKPSGSLNTALPDILEKICHQLTDKYNHCDQRDLLIQLPNNPIAGAVRIHYKERDGMGVDAEDFDQVFSDAKRLFASLKTSQGDNVIEQVVRVRDHCDGPFVDDLPDMLIVWSRDATRGKFGSRELGEFEFHPDPANILDFRTGDHISKACFLANEVLEENTDVPQKLASEELMAKIIPLVYR